MDIFEKEIVDILKKEIKYEIKLEIPPDSKLGDYAFPCFSLSNIYKKNPVEIAKELSTKLKPIDLIIKIDANGPYVNFFINKVKFTDDLIKRILKEKNNFGKGQNNSNIMVEFFHANTHKGVHIGHIRNICLGESLCRILEFDGNKVNRVNYQGDIGPHVAKCIWGYLNLGHKESKDHKGTWLGKIYAEANHKAENLEIEEQIREINNKLYQKDKKLTAVWKKTRKYCLDDFKEIYKDFGVKYDRFYFESEVESIGKEIALELLKKGIAKKSEGAIIMDLKKFDLDIYLILSKEGNALYSTKDLGLAQLKIKEFKKIDKSIHVVGSEQEMYFRQLFKTFELMGFDFGKKSYHLSYGLVMLPEGKMSSREGTLVLYDDLKEKMIGHAKQEVVKRHKDWSQKQVDDTARMIAFGALKYSMIKPETNRVILFDWEKALDFEGDTGPYLMYAVVRINSILEKLGKEIKKADFSLLKEEKELELVRKLNEFPEVVEKSASNLKPHLMANYLFELAQKFNEFYHSCPVLLSEEELKKARAMLCIAVKHVLENGLRLLGIETINKM